MIRRFCSIFSLFINSTIYEGTFGYFNGNCSLKLSDIVLVRLVIIFRANKTADLGLNPLQRIYSSQFRFFRGGKIMLELHRLRIFISSRWIGTFINNLNFQCWNHHSLLSLRRQSWSLFIFKVPLKQAGISNIRHWFCLIIH